MQRLNSTKWDMHVQWPSFLLLMIIIINVVEDLFFKEKKEAK